MSRMLRRGATLVDLLTAAAIVSLTVALFLPAVYAQTARSRQHRCANNLMQIGLAIQNFHDIRQEICPSYLTTDLESYAPTDHAAWPILLMPFMELGNEYDQFDLTQPVSKDVKGHAAARTKSLAVFFCSARRVPPQLTTDKSATVGDYGNVSYGVMDQQGRSVDPAKPETYNGAMMVCRAFNASDKPNTVKIGPFQPGTLGGGEFRSMTSFASVIDGLSNTAFLGEKAAHQERLGVANPAGTHQDGMLYYGKGGSGKNALTNPGPMAYWSRRLAAEPSPDQASILPTQPLTQDPDNRFGSWHPKVTLFAIGDGSVKWVYNATAHTPLERFGARNDRQTFDLPQVAQADVPRDDRPRIAQPAGSRPNVADRRILNKLADELLEEAERREVKLKELMELIQEREKAREGKP